MAVYPSSAKRFADVVNGARSLHREFAIDIPVTWDHIIGRLCIGANIVDGGDDHPASIHFVDGSETTRDPYDGRWLVESR